MDGAVRANDPILHDWQRPHAELQRIARTRGGLDYEEGRWLLLAVECRVQVHLGYGSFGEYGERVLGHGRHETAERLRVARQLEKLPLLGQALRDGVLHWSAVRELTRVAIAKTEGEWLKAAANQTVHDVQRMVSGLTP